MTTPRPWYRSSIDPANYEHHDPRWYALAYTRPDGGISQLTKAATFDTPAEEKAALEAEARQRVAVGQRWWIYEIHDWIQKTDRLGGTYFGNAFQLAPGNDIHEVGGITVDMPYARAIFRHHIREVRDPLLNALDVEFYRALETGADTTDIVAQKQVLRDLPQDPAIEAATTPQELFDAWPTALLGERSTAGRGRPGRGYYESPGTY